MSWRAILGLPIAGAVVMLLFLFMAGVISVDDVVPGEKVEREEINILRRIEEPRPLKVEKPNIEQLKEPEPPETPERSIDPQPFDGGEPIGPQGGGEVTLGEVEINREPTPIQRVDPQGFEGCFSSGNAGGEERVRVRFDIAPSGETTNVQIVDSTDSCFERSAQRAVRRWRYNPKTERGEAVWQYGVTTTIVYRQPE